MNEQERAAFAKWEPEYMGGVGEKEADDLVAAAEWGISYGKDRALAVARKVEDECSEGNEKRIAKEIADRIEAEEEIP